VRRIPIGHIQLETIMGLMDVLRGMQYGPHGPASRSGTGSGTGTGTGSGGVSPITMAIIGLLAYKALKSMSHHEEPAPSGGLPRLPGGNGGDMAARDLPGRDMQGIGREGSEMQGGGSSVGGLADLLKGALGGLLAGSAAGGVMGGGLSDLIRQMQKHGFADTADSWVGPGRNRTIAPDDLAKVLGADQIDAMMEQSGLSRQELLEGLSRHLPEVVDQLTPEGQVPRHIPM
jgi:uncharacterized protein YidB (DUF937 family)